MVDLNGLSMSSLYKTTGMAFYVLVVVFFKVGKAGIGKFEHEQPKKKFREGESQSNTEKWGAAKKMMTPKKPIY